VNEDQVAMDKFTFGITMLVVGMGGTLLTLGVMSVIMSVLKRIFPYKKEVETDNKRSGEA
jgi:hypothetical protein